MMVCSQALINLARKMKERWGIPFFEGSFYGVSATSQSLRTIARMLVAQGAGADLVARTEDLIATEEARVASELEPLLPRLAGKRALLYTGGVKSWSVVSALQDAGMVVIGTSVRKSTPDDKARAQALMGEDGELFESLTQREMYRMLKAGEADIMLSGGRTQFVALKAKAPWLDINQERHYAYAGYAGAVTLAREVDRALSNPIWRQVRAPAPWEA
jgi:nitrogenase molybdenum-cofactor synthesis protein NifE